MTGGTAPGAVPPAPPEAGGRDGRDGDRQGGDGASGPRPRARWPAPEFWLPAGVAALTLWALLWYLCTPERADAVPLGDLRSGLLVWTRADGAVAAGGWASARVVVVTALFGLAVAWAVRAVPPAGRRWPWTLLLCVALAVACGAAATTLVGLVQPLDGAWASRGDELGAVIGAGADVLIPFGAVAAGLGLLAAALGRAPVPAATGVPDAPAPDPGPAPALAAGPRR